MIIREEQKKTGYSPVFPSLQLLSVTQKSQDTLPVYSCVFTVTFILTARYPLGRIL